MLMDFAHDLKFLGLIGLKKLINFRESLVVEELRRNGVQLCILSTDSTLDNITDYNTIKLFKDFRPPLNVTGVTEREVEDSLKQCLKTIVDRRFAETQSRFSKDEISLGYSGIVGRTSRVVENDTRTSRMSVR